MRYNIKVSIKFAICDSLKLWIFKFFLYQRFEEFGCKNMIYHLHVTPVKLLKVKHR